MTAPRRTRASAGRTPPKTVADVPVTQAMLMGVRDELMERIEATRTGLDARFTGLEGTFVGLEGKFVSLEGKFVSLEGKFVSLEGQFVGLEARFVGLEARFTALESELHGMAAEIARIGVLVEEQNARNSVVLEAIHALIGREQRLEHRVEVLEQHAALP